MSWPNPETDSGAGAILFRLWSVGVGVLCPTLLHYLSSRSNTWLAWTSGPASLSRQQPLASVYDPSYDTEDERSSRRALTRHRTFSLLHPETMVLLKSTKDMPVGTEAPEFALLEPVTGRVRSLSDLRGESGTLVVFISNHCPFVVHIREELGRLGTDLAAKGVTMIGIGSNDVGQFPEDGPDAMAALARTTFKSFSYLYDESQETAKAYKAVCTPDFYLLDKDLKLFYRGRLDASRPGNREPVTGSDMRAAVDAMLSGADPSSSPMPSMGCSIKWKPGNFPS